MYCDSLLLQIPKFSFRTTLQFISSQVSNILLALPDLSLKMLPVLATEPFVGSRGPDYTTGPFGSDLLAQAKVSPEEIWEGDGTKFPYPERE